MTALLRTCARACTVAACAVSTCHAQAWSQGKVSGDNRPAFEQCPEIACNGTDQLSAMFNDSLRGRPRPLGGPSGERSKNASVVFSGEGALGVGNKHSTPVMNNCPPNREQLGAATWTLLHAVAAYYPESPSDAEREAAAGLLRAIALLYPCKHCRAAFEADIVEHIPELGSRSSFSLWLCSAHNRVSTSLGKVRFPCTMEALDERWRRGRPECWVGAAGAATQEGQTAEESLGQAENGES